MKTTKSGKWQVASDTIKGEACEVHSCHVSRVTCHPFAFTLIELLTVIAIIGVLATLSFSALGRIKRQQYIGNATAEMEKLETAIERYKAAYGFYPPDNPANALVNQLYFELLGTTNLAIPPAAPFYRSLDDPTIQVQQSDLNTAFGPSVSGFMNCSKPGSGEDAPKAQNFLLNYKPDQITLFSNNNVGIKIIVTSVGGPDITYKPLGPGATGINPWRYNSSSPTNNPGGYDLWIQLCISGKTNLICNWDKQVQLNSPLP